MAPPALKFDRVSFRYGEAPVLEEVSFELRAENCLCAIGPNGGGKTTLLKLALGLLRPNQGKIETLNHSPHLGCTQIGYVPQHLHFDPHFPITAQEVVLMGRLDRLPWTGRYAKSDREAVHCALGEVGLEEVGGKPFSALSGGQKQRVLIARALFTKPKLLFLDEPTANIDLTVEEQFLRTLEQVRDRMTILVVTHDLGLVERLTDRVLCVNRRVHEHRVSDLDGQTIREIYSVQRREIHYGIGCDHD